MSACTLLYTLTLSLVPLSNCKWTDHKDIDTVSCHKIYIFVQHIYNFLQSIHRLLVSALLDHHQALYMDRFLTLVHFGIPNCYKDVINPLKPELNPIFYLLALLGAHHFLYFSRIRVKSLTFRRLMSYIYIWSTHS